MIKLKIFIKNSTLNYIYKKIKTQKKNQIKKNKKLVCASPGQDLMCFNHFFFLLGGEPL